MIISRDVCTRHQDVHFCLTPKEKQLATKNISLKKHCSYTSCLQSLFTHNESWSFPPRCANSAFGFAGLRLQGFCTLSQALVQCEQMSLNLVSQVRDLGTSGTTNFTCNAKSQKHSRYEPYSLRKPDKHEHYALSGTHTQSSENSWTVNKRFPLFLVHNIGFKQSPNIKRGTESNLVTYG